MSKALITKSH